MLGSSQKSMFQMFSDTRNIIRCLSSRVSVADWFYWILLYRIPAGYARIVLALLSFYLMPCCPWPSVFCYLLSGLLDAFDGHAARALNQCKNLFPIQRETLSGGRRFCLHPAFDQTSVDIIHRKKKRSNFCFQPPNSEPCWTCWRTAAPPCVCWSTSRCSTPPTPSCSSSAWPWMWPVTGCTCTGTPSLRDARPGARRWAE